MDAVYFAAIGLGAITGSAISWAERQWFKVDTRTWPVCRMIVAAAILAGVFALLYFHYGLSVKTGGYAALSSILCMVALADIDSATIPDPLIIAGLVVWVLTVWFVAVPPTGFGAGSSFFPFFGQGFIPVMFDCLLGACVTAGGVLLFSVVYEQVTHRPSIGGGDIKLLFMVGLYLGLAVSVFNLFLSCLLGLVFAPILRKIAGDRVESESTVKTFPFGPAIAAATSVTLTIGPWLPL